jgi:hypothetical protein
MNRNTPGRLRLTSASTVHGSGSLVTGYDEAERTADALAEQLE